MEKLKWVRGFLLALSINIGGALTSEPAVAAPIAICEPPPSPQQPGDGAAGKKGGTSWRDDEVLRGLFGLNATDPWDKTRADLAQQIDRLIALTSGGGSATPMTVPPQVDDTMTLLKKMMQLPPGSPGAGAGTLPLAMYNFQVAAPGLPGQTLPQKLQGLLNARDRAGVRITADERMKMNAVIEGLNFFVAHYPTLRAMVGNDHHLTSGDANASINSVLGQIKGILLGGHNPETGERLPFGGAILRGRNRRLGWNPILDTKMAEMSAGPRAQLLDKLVRILGSAQPADPGPHNPDFYAVKRMGEDAQRLGHTFKRAFNVGNASLGDGPGAGEGPLEVLRLFVDSQGLDVRPMDELYRSILNGTLPTNLTLPTPPVHPMPAGEARAVPGKTVYIAPGKPGSTSSYGYLVSLPKDYKEGTPYDVVFYLHGTDSRGRQPNAVSATGLAAAVTRYRAAGGDVQAVVVTPLLPANAGWDPADINRLRDDMVKQYGNDPSRTYAIGHSLGGIAALAVAREGGWNKVVSNSGAMPYPDPFGMTRDPEALAAWAKGFEGKNVLVRYGTEDAIVPTDLQNMTSRALLAANPNARVQVLPGVGHTMTMNFDYIQSAATVGWLGDAFGNADAAFRKPVMRRR